MTSHLPNAPAIAACAEATPNWTPIYDAFVARLAEAGVGASAPHVGDFFPEFALPDVRGRYRSLESLIQQGPVVLSFNRGGWCPFCRTELTAWGDHAEALARAGGRFVSISGETGGRAGRLKELVGAEAEVLVDVDHGLALEVGLAFRCDKDLQRRYLSCGLDLADVYGNGSWFLPVPATFVVDRDLAVRFAFANPDFRVRASPAEVIAVVDGLY